MINDDLLKWVCTGSLVVIAICSIINAIHIAEIRRQTIALQHVVSDPDQYLPADHPFRQR
ncbi:MAG TPA: hypothetical protein VF582_05870 [Allosphingosinicella sp.]